MNSKIIWRLLWPPAPTNLNDLNRKPLSGFIFNLISFTFCRKCFFFHRIFELSTLYVPGRHVNCILQTHLSSSSNSRSSAGVGNALEGGRGRAGTKLFQDFQMLSRIWTHPWCLQLDYISKENRVGWRKLSPNCAKCWFKNWESIRLIGSVDRPCTSGSNPCQCYPQFTSSSIYRSWCIYCCAGELRIKRSVSETSPPLFIST